MRVFRPLLGSLHALPHHQPWQPVGVWRRAINLMAADGRLLTLHRQGSGIGPGGWVLRGADFDRISSLLCAGMRIQTLPEGLLIADCLLRPPVRHGDLRLTGNPAAPHLRMPWLHGDPLTGLYGPLSQAVLRPLPAVPAGFCDDFAAALNGGRIDWRRWLGKGPGLTPSHDDMLVGMLLAAKYFGAPVRPDFFAASGALISATTSVSVSYLHHAAAGRFASPLLHFAQALARQTRLVPATTTLLGLGHTSGADTLLGFWLGQIAIKG